MALFPQLVAGPIVRYTTVMEDITHRRETLDESAAGVTRFCFGLAKKMVIANAMGQIADGVFNQTAANLDPGLAWVGALAYTFQIYFDFSAYSDMAIGLDLYFVGCVVLPAAAGRKVLVGRCVEQDARAGAPRLYDAGSGH